MQDLSNELADKKEELNAANRKLHTLKSSSDALPNLPSQSSLPLPVSPSCKHVTDVSQTQLESCRVWAA